MTQNLEGTPVNSETLIQPKPLRYIRRTRELLTHGQNETTPHWTKVSEGVKPFNSALELSDNIREATYGFIFEKIPTFKKTVHSIREFSDDELADTIVHKWFEDVNEKVDGERRKVLLAVASHIVSRIETKAYKDILSRANDEELEKIGLNRNTANLAIELLDVATKTDPLFIRYMSFSQETPKQPDEASETGIYIPGNNTARTLASLFPHESGALANGLQKIAATDAVWITEPDADIFKEYATTLSRMYRERNPQVAQSILAELDTQYRSLLRSRFPIFLLHPTEAWFKRPHFDPDLRVSIAAPEARDEQKKYDHAKDVMSECLGEIHLEKFSEQVKDVVTRISITLGAYGVNTVFNAVAQENPAVMLYLNEQIRQLDEEFPQYIKLISNYKQEFNEVYEMSTSVTLSRSRNQDTPAASCSQGSGGGGFGCIR